jgi:hypothetical protein
MLFDGRTIWMVNILSPSGRIWIRAAAEAWKQIEFQMVVAVNQSWQDQIAAEIQFRPFAGRTSPGLTAAAPDFEIDAVGGRAAERYSCAR